MSPEVHYVVLVVPSVQVHVVGVKQKVGEQEHYHLYGLFSSINKVPIKHIRRLGRRKAILRKQEKKVESMLQLCFRLSVNDS